MVLARFATATPLPEALSPVEGGAGDTVIGPAGFLGGGDENIGNPFVAGEVAQPELHRIHVQIRSDFIDRGFAREDAGQVSRRAKVAGSQRPLALLHPGNVRRQNFLVFERVDLASASGAVQKSRHPPA